ncbi:M1 family aminopeptidase [Bowmanella sp. JS7-9]|uniref:M1 family aminopeptidase n=1 Tax=Pseudobowmanella zhangzhouensis TaxID=1537679 RepID=A0ABW1XS68_9ALTE|nr:M1 family aminopeptidase [Bowmanella sp. JS7-9]TBX23581.1 hypothetical protein TK45_05535 [Bowmanella sp. JS7-9]
MLLANEWRFALRQPLIWLGLLLPALFAFTLSVGMQVVEDDAIGHFQLLLIAQQMMSLPLICAGFTPVLLYRDSQWQMDEIIHATPTSLFRRNLSRLLVLASLLVTSALLSNLVILFNQPSLSGLFSALFTYTLFYSVPAALLLTTLAQAVSLRLSAGVSYLLFGGLWMGYLYLASLTGNPILAGSTISSELLYACMLWLDPFGITAHIKALNGHSTDTSLAIWMNRLLFTASAAVGGVWLCQFAAVKRAIKSRRERESTDVLQSSKVYKAVSTQPPGFSHLLTLWGQTVRHLLSQRINIVLLLGWSVLVFNTAASSAAYVEPFSIHAASSNDALRSYAFDMLPLLGCVLLAWWAWQIGRRAQRAHFAEVLAATPLRSIWLVWLDALTLATMLALLLLLSAVGTGFAELFLQSSVSLQSYGVALGANGLSLLVIGMLFIALQHSLRSSALAAGGMAIILLLKFTPIMAWLGMPHTLWNPGWTPLQPADDFWGYTASAQAFWPYMRAWLLFACTALIFASALSHRGSGLPVVRSTQKTYWLALPALLCVGVFWQLHLQLTEERPLYNSVKREAFKANYEKSLGQWRDALQPVISHIDARIDFYPEAQNAELALRYTLTNPHSKPIRDILIGRAAFYHAAELAVPDADILHSYPELNQTIYRLRVPMQPGETRQFSAAFSYQQPELWPVSGQQFVTPAMSYLRSVPLIPTLGYQTTYELTDEHLRADHGLPLYKKVPPSMLFANADAPRGSYDWITLTSTLSTNRDQVALSQGKLTDHQQQGERHTYTYQTRSPIRAIPAWFSLPALVTRSEHNGVNLNVFVDPASAAVPLHMQAMTDTLDWFAQNLAPYRASQLNLIAMPEIGLSGYALPQLILINHDHGFRAHPNAKAGFDQRYRRTVHETAHQWFGHDIGNGEPQDSAFLIESLAKYVELVVIEQRYGQQAMQALVDYEQQRFDQAHRNHFGPLPAMVDASKSFQQYSQATVVFARLRKELGDEVILNALRALWQHHSYPNPPANAMDFVRYIQEFAGEEHQKLIERLLLERTEE